MPFISVKTNRKINEEKRLELKSELGKAISIIPGKSENWLMVDIEDGRNLYFRGSGSEDIVFAEVKIFGGASRQVYDKLTERLTDILRETAGAEEIYIKYEEAETWGYNGGNF